MKTKNKKALIGLAVTAGILFLINTFVYISVKVMIYDSVLKGLYWKEFVFFDVLRELFIIGYYDRSLIYAILFIRSFYSLFKKKETELIEKLNMAILIVSTVCILIACSPLVNGLLSLPKWFVLTRRTIHWGCEITTVLLCFVVEYLRIRSSTTNNTDNDRIKQFVLKFVFIALFAILFSIINDKCIQIVQYPEKYIDPFIGRLLQGVLILELVFMLVSELVFILSGYSILKKNKTGRKRFSLTVATVTSGISILLCLSFCLVLAIDNFVEVQKTLLLYSELIFYVTCIITFVSLVTFIVAKIFSLKEKSYIIK